MGEAWYVLLEKAGMKRSMVMVSKGRMVCWREKQVLGFRY